MQNRFLIIETPAELPDKICGIGLALKDKKLHVYLTGKYKKINDTLILIDGFAIPRNDFFSEYKNTDQHELVYELYKVYGRDFPLSLKGFFNIIVIDRFIEHFVKLFGLSEL